MNLTRLGLGLNRVILVGLLGLLVLSPLPLGSNREWSWSLCAVLVAVLGICWSLLNVLPRQKPFLPAILWWLILPVMLVLVWILVQMAGWVPGNWKHPLWQMAAQALDLSMAGYVTLSVEDGTTAFMRLLSYFLVFFLAMQLGRDRENARIAFFTITLAGLAYAGFGLYVYWSGQSPVWLFGEQQLPHDVRSTFVNRNHFVTWQGLTVLCAIALFYQGFARPVVTPYSVPQNREEQMAAFLQKSWKPLTAILIMITALVLTHSRGGFLSALAGTVTLLILLDRRGSRRKTWSRSAVITALIVVSLAFQLTSEGVMQRLENTDVTSEERLVIFDNVQRGIAASPIMGFGYGTFADSFRLFDRIESPYHYDRAHNTWLENVFELGIPAALTLYLAILGIFLVCLKGVFSRHRDWVYPAIGVAASVLVGLHATVDFSLQIPAIAYLYAAIMGIACAQSFSSGQTIQ